MKTPVIYTVLILGVAALSVLAWRKYKKAGKLS
jgi:hypothetical protein